MKSVNESPFIFIVNIKFGCSVTNLRIPGKEILLCLSFSIKELVRVLGNDLKQEGHS